MTFSRLAVLVALMLPAVLVGQQTAAPPTAAELKARAEAAKQRAAQQQPQPATKQQPQPATKQQPQPATKQQPPATKTAASTPAAGTPQTKTATAPQTRAGTPAAQTRSPAAVAQQPVPPRQRDEVTFNREVFQYVAANRRDPFVSMITSSDLRPQVADLKLVTIISTQGGGGSVAILRDLVTKEQYRVRVGQTLGRMRVAQIQPRAVVFSIEEFGYNRQEVLTMNDSTKARTP